MNKYHDYTHTRKTLLKYNVVKVGMGEGVGCPFGGNPPLIKFFAGESLTCTLL